MRKKVLIITAAALAAAVLVSVPAVFAVRESRELASARSSLADTDAALKSLAAELESSKAASQSALEALQASLDAQSREKEDLEKELAETQDALAKAQAQIEELTAFPRFDPDGPEYQSLYPDFYAPQPLDASQAPGKVIYLTFDDGPSARTDEVLKILEREGIHGTFFIVGQAGSANRDRLRSIAAAGHTLGMHSWSHNYKAIYESVEAFLDDMYKVFTLIRDETGITPTCFRFPGGSTNAASYGVSQEIIAEMLRRGFVPYDWNMSAQDATSKPLPPETITANVLSAGNVSRGVVLMHDSAARSTTVEALPSIIASLRERGYTFAPLTPEVKPVVFGYRSPKFE